MIASPLQWLPSRLHSSALALILNHLLADPLGQGDLRFLHGRVVGLDVDGLGLSYRLRLGDRGFAVAPADAPADVRFRGDVLTFLLLATQREDTDTLFFQRRLRIEGDTATGLHLKNFLDAFGGPPLPAAARGMLEHLTDAYARLCGVPAADQARQLNPGRPAQ